MITSCSCRLITAASLQRHHGCTQHHQISQICSVNRNFRSQDTSKKGHSDCHCSGFLRSRRVQSKIITVNVHVFQIHPQCVSTMACITTIDYNMQPLFKHQRLYNHKGQHSTQPPYNYSQYSNNIQLHIFINYTNYSVITLCMTICLNFTCMISTKHLHI